MTHTDILKDRLPESTTNEEAIPFPDSDYGKAINNRAIFGIQAILPYAIEEAVNRLRINVSFLGSDVKKIMVVSSEPNEGKSFVAMHLWRQMAIAGERSILVDCDMRKSNMMDTYAISRQDGREVWGLTHYLSDNKKLEDVILSTDIEGGDIIPNSNNIVNPSILLESDRFSKLLDILTERYRYVFLDVPPLGLVSDAERIGNLCDGALLTVRSAATPKAIVRNSVAQLERSGCPLLGIVLNRVGDSKRGYYGNKYYGGKYYYGKYYNNEYYRQS